MPTQDTGNQNDQPFPIKLYNMMEKEPHVLKWNTDGKSFRIIDEDILVKNILLQHFRTARFSSFTRNLNIYGFKKIAKGEFAGSYFHPKFSRGDIKTIASMKRCPRKPSTGVKCETKSKSNAKKPSSTPQTSDVHSKPEQGIEFAANLPPSKRPSLQIKSEPKYEDSLSNSQQDNFDNDFEIMSMGKLQHQDSGFLGSSFGSDADLSIPMSEDHELALPNANEFDDCFNTTFNDHHDRSNINQFCSTPCQSLDHFQNPFTEDDDLVEWKKVLNHCAGHDIEEERPNGGPNAYCVNVPAGPLGVMIEKRGDKVCLSRFTNPNSPLAHVPIGSQLVNLDGRDTTRMVVCQITKLDKSVRHRSRMIIFMACPTNDVQEKTQAQTAQNSNYALRMENKFASDENKYSDDIDMETDSTDPASFIALPAPTTPVSTWWSVSGMQSFYEAM